MKAFAFTAYNLSASQRCCICSSRSLLLPTSASIQPSPYRSFSSTTPTLKRKQRRFFFRPAPTRDPFKAGWVDEEEYTSSTSSSIVPDVEIDNHTGAEVSSSNSWFVKPDVVGEMIKKRDQSIQETIDSGLSVDEINSGVIVNAQDFDEDQSMSTSLPKYIDPPRLLNPYISNPSLISTLPPISNSSIPSSLHPLHAFLTQHRTLLPHSITFINTSHVAPRTIPIPSENVFNGPKAKKRPVDAGKGPGGGASVGGWWEWVVIAEVNGRGGREVGRAEESVRQWLLNNASPPDLMVPPKAPKPPKHSIPSEWSLLDCGSVCIHIFTPVARKKINIDGVWSFGVDNAPPVASSPFGNESMSDRKDDEVEKEKDFPPHWKLQQQTRRGLQEEDDEEFIFKKSGAYGLRSGNDGGWTRR